MTDVSAFVSCSASSIAGTSSLDGVTIVTNHRLDGDDSLWKYRDNEKKIPNRVVSLHQQLYSIGK